MKIRQLEEMLVMIPILNGLINDGPLGMNRIKELIIELENEIHGQLMILVYEKYQMDKEAGD